MHRPRGRAALSRPELDPTPEPLPQAWVPRVVNVALAAFLQLFLVPLYTHLGGRATSVQVMLGIVSLPFVLLTFACLVSAARPGSLGRAARKVRARRSG